MRFAMSDKLQFVVDLVFIEVVVIQEIDKLKFVGHRLVSLN